MTNDATCTAFCPQCGKNIPYSRVTRPQWVTIRGTTFSYGERLALCPECGEEVYVAAVSDLNVRTREQAYFRALESSREKK